MQSIVKVFMNKACNTDIREMLDEVCVLTIIKVYALILLVGHYELQLVKKSFHHAMPKVSKARPLSTWPNW